MAQRGANPPANELVEHCEGAGMSVLEVAEPAAQRPIEIDDDAGEAVAARAFRLRSDAVLEAGGALLPGARPPRPVPVRPDKDGFAPIPRLAHTRPFAL